MQSLDALRSRMCVQNSASVITEVICTIAVKRGAGKLTQSEKYNSSPKNVSRMRGGKKVAILHDQIKKIVQIAATPLYTIQNVHIEEQEII